MPEQQLLERDRSVGRGQLHGVQCRLVVLDGQHRAHAVRRRHGHGRRGRRRVRQLRAWQVPERERRDSVRRVRRWVVLRRRLSGAAAVPERQLLERDRPLGRGQLYRVSSWALVHYSQHCANTMRTGHDRCIGGRCYLC